jgi:hypothetical protein
MKPLQHIVAIALAEAGESALARFLESLGAQVKTITSGSIREHLPSADILIDQYGMEVLADLGFTPGAIERLNPRLIHVSVTPFGSGGPRSRWIPC